MKSKVLVLSLALLVLAEIIYCAALQQQNSDNLNKMIDTLDRKLQEARADRDAYIGDRAQILKELRSVPQAVLSGFEDPEKKFVDFMDYLRNSSIKELGGKVTVSGNREFDTNPVPLQKTRLRFDFTFTNAADLGTLFDYLLNQKEFPLNVNSLDIKRRPGQKPNVILDLSLLIPNKIELPDEVKKFFADNEVREGAS
jgi:hypothetical protein